MLVKNKECVQYEKRATHILQNIKSLNTKGKLHYCKFKNPLRQRGNRILSAGSKNTVTNLLGDVAMEKGFNM